LIEIHIRQDQSAFDDTMASSPTPTLTSTPPLTPGVHVVTTPAASSSLIDGIVHLHAACILHDHTLATFLPPLSHPQLYEWWEKRFTEVTAGEMHIIMQVSRVADRTTNHGLVEPPWIAEGRGWPVVAADGGGGPDAADGVQTQTQVQSETQSQSQEQGQGLEISGVVSLGTPFSQTGPFRALVQKLFVHPLHRRQGIARKLMARLETLALAHGRWNLMLDTEVGSGAENVYPKLGYERLGVVREYGYSPRDGRLVDEVWYWKDLRKMARLEEVEKEV
jgi:ribosomal protein S18 acetylase RimI-like enzyme